MSLDVYLNIGPERIEPCPHCGGTGKIDQGREEVYSANITHNLTEMASEAGLYEACWRPEDIGITKAAQLVSLLQVGLNRLVAEPDRFRKFNAPNGWGCYEHFLAFVKNYLAACNVSPDADVSVSR